MATTESDPDAGGLLTARLPRPLFLAMASAVAVVLWLAMRPPPFADEAGPGADAPARSGTPRLDAVIAETEGASRQLVDELGTVLAVGEDRGHVMLLAGGQEISVQPDRPVPREIGPADVVRVKGRTVGRSRFGTRYVRGTWSVVRRVAASPPCAPARIVSGGRPRPRFRARFSRRCAGCGSGRRAVRD
jgi:hypothetical protein